MANLLKIESTVENAVASNIVQENSL